MIDWLKTNWKTALVGGVVAIIILWGLVGCGSETKPVEEVPVETETPAVEEVKEVETLPAVEEEVVPVEEPVEEVPAVVPTEDVVE
jgi:hypothetical protein